MPSKLNPIEYKRGRRKPLRPLLLGWRGALLLPPAHLLQAAVSACSSRCGPRHRLAPAGYQYFYLPTYNDTSMLQRQMHRDWL